MSEELIEVVAAALWQGRLEREDPDIYECPWEMAIQEKDVCIAYEVQEIRADARVAIAAALPKGSVCVRWGDLSDLRDAVTDDDGYWFSHDHPDVTERIDDALRGWKFDNPDETPNPTVSYATKIPANDPRWAHLHERLRIVMGAHQWTIMQWAVWEALAIGMVTLPPEPEPAYPPVSGGSHDDETACGALCQQHNDAAWAKLGPVDDVELPF